ncbi:MAG: O-antigen ligase family protein [Oscillospiraceae bacterium]|jgi:hypothetical protein|nr:O-antigen ligase family protein [Oscillospiraceae bacterium]
MNDRPNAPARWLMRLAPAYILAYLLLILYAGFNPTAFSIVLRVALHPASAMLAALMLAQPGVFGRLETKLLLGYVAWIAVSSLCGVLLYGWQLYAAYQNTQFHMIFSALVCFPLPFALPVERRKPVFRTMLCAFLTVCTALCVLALITVLTQTPVLAADGRVLVGISQLHNDSRLVIAGMHPNATGSLCMLVLLLTLYLAGTSRHLLVRTLCGLAMIPQYAVIGLTDSRAAMIITTLGLACAGFLWVWRQRALKALSGALLGVGLALVISVASYFALTLSVRLVAQATAAWAQAPAPVEALAREIESAVQQAQTPGENPAPPDGANTPALQLTEQRALMPDLQSFTGRTDIWRTVLYVLKTHPQYLLTGISHDGMAEAHPMLERFGGEAHNAYLQVLAATGLPGFVALAVFLLLLFLSSLRVVLPRRGLSFGDQFLPVVLLCCCVGAMLESIYLIGGQGPFHPLFYLVAGFVCCTPAAAQEA